MWGYIILQRDDISQIIQLLPFHSKLFWRLKCSTCVSLSVTVNSRIWFSLFLKHWKCDRAILKHWCVIFYRMSWYPSCTPCDIPVLCGLCCVWFTCTAVQDGFNVVHEVFYKLSFFIWASFMPVLDVLHWAVWSYFQTLCPISWHAAHSCTSWWWALMVGTDFSRKSELPYKLCYRSKFPV